MTQFLATLLFIGNAAFASELVITNKMVGEFSYSYGYTEDYRYLECNKETPLFIENDSSQLLILGVTYSPLVFENIDEAPTGVSGPMIGFSQHQTITTQQNQLQTTIETQSRTCEPFLGSIGCIGKKWRTTSWVQFTQNSNDEVSVTIGYQPFEQISAEFCTFIKQ